MTKASVQGFCVAVVCAVGLTSSLPVWAQTGTTITIQGVTCANWSLTGTAPAIVLTCNAGTANPPVCTVTGSGTATVGVIDALTASCTPAATSYLWAGGSCANATGATCRANEASVGVQNYTVTGTNSAGAGTASPAFAVNWLAGTPGVAPTGCAFTSTTPAAATPLSSGGGSVSMTASCTGSITSWIWWKNGNSWVTRGAISPVTQGDSLPANTTTAAVTYTYTAVACNGAVCSTPITTNFTVAAAAGGGGGGGGGVPNCAVPGITIPVPIAWNSVGNQFPNPQMGPNDAVVFVLTTPPSPAATPITGPLGQLALAEFGGGTGTARWITVSTSPCDWKPVDFNWSFYQASPNLQFSFVTNFVGQVSQAVAPLQPNTTYYINIKNYGPGGQAPQCSNQVDCGFSYNWSKPAGS